MGFRHAATHSPRLGGGDDDDDDPSVCPAGHLDGHRLIIPTSGSIW
jgi:hypothetical protein